MLYALAQPPCNSQTKVSFAHSLSILSPQEWTRDWNFLVATDPLLYFRSLFIDRFLYLLSKSTTCLCILNSVHLYKWWCTGRSRWPHGLRRRSAATRLPGLQVRILPVAWKSVSFEYCVLSLIQSSPTKCVLVTECDQVQQKPSTPTISRQTEIRIRWKKKMHT